jgi:hypothetical protein
VLSRGHAAIEQFFHSRPGMIGLWACGAELVLRGGGIADKILLHEQHSVPFSRVYGRIEL